MPVDLNTVTEFLRGTYIASLATHNRDGSMHVIPIWYLFEEGVFYLPTGPNSVKVRNVTERPHASVLVDSRGPGPLRAASTSGPAEVLRAEAARQFNERCWERYLTPAGRADPAVGGLLEAYDTVCIRVVATRWSWSDLGLIFQGKLEDRTWVRPYSP